MPASSRCLRLIAIATRASRSIARLILAVLTLCAAGRSMAQGLTSARGRPRAHHADPSSANPRCGAGGARRSPIFMTGIFRTTTPASEIRGVTHRPPARALSAYYRVGGRSNLLWIDDGRHEPAPHPWRPEHFQVNGPVAVRRRGRPTSRPLSSATRADFDQTIKPYLILLDSLGQSVSVGIGLVNAI